MFDEETIINFDKGGDTPSANLLPAEISKSKTAEIFNLEQKIDKDQNAKIDFEADTKSKGNASHKPLTDIGNAERFIEQHGNNIRFCPELKKWIIFEGGRWVQDTGERIFRKAKETILNIISESKDVKLSPEEKADIVRHMIKSSTPARIKAMLEFAQWEKGITVNAADLDSNQWFLNCKNGTLNLKTNELKPHNPDDLITKITPSEFNPDASCAIWDSFLHRIMDGDQTKIDFLQRVIGYSLTGDTSEHAIFILYGNGSNGKSTLLETLRVMLGGYAKHTSSNSLLSQRWSQIPNDIARLNGARFVSAVEISMGKKLDEAQIKQLTGGDQVVARFLRQEFFEFRPSFKIFISSNYKPEIRGVDHGIWRRIYLIPFNVSIPNEEIDSRLPEKLLSELPGILAWAVRGCLEWQREGLNPPEKIREATASYREEMDILSAFFEDRCELKAELKIPLADLYSNYRRWSELSCQEIMGKKVFGNLMRQKGFSQAKSGGIRYWKGILLKPETLTEY